MKTLGSRAFLVGAALWFVPAMARAADEPDAMGAAALAESRTKSDADADKRAADWVAALNLTDSAKAARVRSLVAAHLKTIRDWHNDHPYSTVSEGINPRTGKPLSLLDRQMIADGALPKSVHAKLMAGLRADLTSAQVEAILDKHTVGKVVFTMNGYRAIVPDLTDKEAATILGYLQQAREEAMDYKNMNQISAVFEIYKTKAEQFLNANGRDWKALYKVYTDAAKAKKAADAADGKK